MLFSKLYSSSFHSRVPFFTTTRIVLWYMVSMLAFMFNYFSLLCISVLVLRCEFLCFYADFSVSSKKKIISTIPSTLHFFCTLIYNTFEMHELEKSNTGTYTTPPFNLQQFSFLSLAPKKNL